MITLEEKFKNMHLLDREERRKITKELEILKPDFLKPFLPRWWWFRPCEVNVLIVCDGGLNFDTGGFGLSEFLYTFNKLEARSPFYIKYKVTLAHRGSIINNPNPVVVNHISGFNFDTSVDLNDFDQVWLFAINPSGSLSSNEINAIENYMNGGGGLFATGDHGALGKAMCGQIPRVKDMRYWDNTPVGSTIDTNEVSMRGRRRNDTNTPRPGNAYSNTFDHQSDNIPQKIGVLQFGNGAFPHPLLSISTSIKPSGVIDTMPDHPHEGECAPETTFNINGMILPTQIIAISFVPGGNTTANMGKNPTAPHCFPSIHVFDGQPAQVGRIVVDSTWHHFVNINLNGAGSIQSGLTNSDFKEVQQYYMNIATWMSRKKFMLCFRRYVLTDLFLNSQLIEASLNNPVQDVKEIKLADLSSIGALAEEILASNYNPAFARGFFLEIMEEFNKNYANMLNVWKPKLSKRQEKTNDYYQGWLNLDLILWTSLGSGFIALRDDKRISSGDISEKDIDRVFDIFVKGMDFGFNASIENLNSNFNNFNELVN